MRRIASRTKAQEMQGPKCGVELRRRIYTFCEENGFCPTIDMFANSCNSLTERFNSWSLEPSAEHTHAFTMRSSSWEPSECPGCGKRHKEHGLYFPPSGLEDPA